MTLHELGAKHGTDKCDKWHVGRAGSYLHVYQATLGTLRNETFTMLEIGVRDGASLRMFEEFFPKATIVGIDIMAGCKKHEKGRIRVRIGDQSDEVFLKTIVDEFGKFRVILDDGSHLNAHIMGSFKFLKNHLTANGVYMIEDLANSHVDLTNDAKTWPGINAAKLGPLLNNSRNRVDLERLFMTMVKDMDLNPLNSFFKRISFYSRQVIMER